MYVEEIQDTKPGDFPENIQYQTFDIMREYFAQVKDLIETGSYTNKCIGLILDSVRNMQIISSLPQSHQESFRLCINQLESIMLEKALMSIQIKLNGNTIEFNMKHEQYEKIILNVKCLLDEDQDRMCLYPINIIRVIIMLHYEFFKLNAWCVNPKQEEERLRNVLRIDGDINKTLTEVLPEVKQRIKKELQIGLEEELCKELDEQILANTLKQLEEAFDKKLRLKLEENLRDALGYIKEPILNIVILPSNKDCVRFIICGEWAIRPNKQQEELVSVFTNPLLCINSEENNPGLIISGLRSNVEFKEPAQFFNMSLLYFDLKSDDNHERIKDSEYEINKSISSTPNAFINKKNINEDVRE